MALDESGCRAYCVRGGWGLNFLSVVKGVSGKLQVYKISSNK